MIKDSLWQDVGDLLADLSAGVGLEPCCGYCGARRVPLRFEHTAFGGPNGVAILILVAHCGCGGDTPAERKRVVNHVLTRTVRGLQRGMVAVDVPT